MGRDGLLDMDGGMHLYREQGHCFHCRGEKVVYGCCGVGSEVKVQYEVLPQHLVKSEGLKWPSH